MSVRSRRVAGPIATTVPNAIIYTVPAGRTLRTSDIALANVGGLADVVTIALVPTAGPAGAILKRSVAAASDTQVVVSWCLNPGDALQVQSTLATTVITIFGALLLGAPT